MKKNDHSGMGSESAGRITGGLGVTRKKFPGSDRKKPAPNLEFDYKNPILLRQFVTETGKIVPARVNRLTAKQQRQLAVAIKRARHIALIPYCDNHSRH